jgi:hypothetical protein
LTLALADRLSTLDKQQLLNLKNNARRLQAEAGPKGEEAAAMLPLIEAEFAKRGLDENGKVRPKRKA